VALKTMLVGIDLTTVAQAALIRPGEESKKDRSGPPPDPLRDLMHAMASRHVEAGPA